MIVSRSKKVKEYNINIDPELRCGHYITSDIKKLWAIELNLLNQLKLICDKHNIKYFAANGTLLGAVRHKGFIPWDDDIDIYMLIDDYEKFCAIAPQELQYNDNYHIQIMHSMTRIRDNHTTAITQGDLNKLKENPEHNCGIFIDIFPLHYIYDSKIRRTIQKFTLRFWERIGTGRKKDLLLRSNPKKYWSFLFSKTFLLWNLFSFFYQYEQYLSFQKKSFAMCKHSYLVGSISFWGVLNPNYIYPKEWFESSVELVFENTTILAPKGYDNILKKEYGDYMIFKKGTQIHTMVVFDTEVPYKEKLKSYFENLK